MMKAWLAAGAALVMTTGCIATPAPKPFTRDVAAAPLANIAPPQAAQEATPEVATGAGMDEADLPPAHIPSPEPGPERIEARADSDAPMMVAERVVVQGRQIPRRAPDYSAEQTASMICLAERTGLSASSARRAHEATLAAMEARRRAEAGLAAWREADDAELKRQDAVRGFIMPVPLLGLIISTTQKKGDLPPPRQGDLVIENPYLFFFDSSGEKVMAVAGVVRNAGRHPAEPPPVTLAALDAWEYQLAGQTSLLPFETLAPGEAREFEIVFHNPPDTTAEVYIHFAPPFAYRSRRDCDSYDASAGVMARPDPSMPAPDRHGAGELNLLTQYYRRESAEAWRCRDWTERGCGWARHALHWRDMFVISEAVDAAWVALRDGQAREAETALAQVRRLGDRALARAGTSAPDIAVEVTHSTHGRDRNGLYVEVAGRVANTADTPRRIDALMLALVDRLELALSSLAIEFPRALAPGESAAFSERVALAEAVDPDRPWAARRNRPADDALARAPPPSIPWQVRVGAMAR